MTPPPDHDERLADWLDDRLGAEELAQLEAEAARDPELRERMAAYRAVAAQVRAEGERERAPDGLTDAVMAAVDAEELRRGGMGRRAVAGLAALAAGVTLALVLWDLMWPAVTRDDTATLAPAAGAAASVDGPDRAAEVFGLTPEDELVLESAVVVAEAPAFAPPGESVDGAPAAPARPAKSMKFGGRTSRERAATPPVVTIGSSSAGSPAVVSPLTANEWAAITRAPAPEPGSVGALVVLVTLPPMPDSKPRAEAEERPERDLGDARRVAPLAQLLKEAAQEDRRASAKAAEQPTPVTVRSGAAPEAGQTAGGPSAPGDRVFVVGSPRGGLPGYLASLRRDVDRRGGKIELRRVAAPAVEADERTGDQDRLFIALRFRAAAQTEADK